MITKGDSFQLIDFQGLVANSLTAPTGWTADAPSAGVTPAPNILLVNGNDPAIPDLTFTYNGDTPITGPVTISGFSAASTFGIGSTTFKDFTGVTTSVGGGRISSVGEVRVPSAGLISPSPAPEPASMVSAAIGLAFAGLYYRRRTRAAA